MSNIVKYRVHDVAKDFGMGSKEITEIMTKYLTTPKNHMQALSDDELNVIFDALTLDNQIESIEVVFAHTYHEPVPEVTEAPQPEPEVQAVPEVSAKSEEPVAQIKPTASDRPAVPPISRAEVPRAATPAASQPKVDRTQRVVDTRGAAAVDLSRFDERVDALVPTSVSKMQQGKQKIKRAPDKKAVSFGQKRRQEEQERLRKLQLEALKKQPVKVMIPDEIAVGELASRMKKTGAEVVKQLMKLGIMASVSEIIDYETAALVAIEMGAKVTHEVVVTIEERLIDDSQDEAGHLEDRDPVIVVMGHVDHGKTSFLDYVRNSSVTAGEFGGITQHIGAYQVQLHDKQITFLDTPGHAAFTSMRARGASITDIAILVVAADDGIMPQTVEAINHAKAAELPIIIAINKMDKEDATPDRIMQQLTEYNLVPEEWGGETICCPVSAKTGEGIPHLLEMILLTASMMELKANPNRSAKGTVIEAKLDKGRGPVATVLVQNGTLKQGDIVIAGKSVGRIRAMTNDKGERLEEAGPSVPVEIIGLAEVPGAGDLFYAVEDERMARELVEQRKQQEKDEANAPLASKMSLEDLYAQIQQGQVKDFNIIVKADVQGSAEALKASLEKLTNEEVRVRVVHSAVGAINESDILLASTASAIIVGFNVRPDASARASAERAGVDMRMYRVIYECIEEIEAAMKGMLTPKFRENLLGNAQVRQVFKVTGAGVIAGSYVRDGKIVRNAKVRLVRDGIVIHEGELSSLKRFKDDAKEVASGYECGIGIEKYNDIKEGDIIEAFVMEEVER